MNTSKFVKHTPLRARRIFNSLLGVSSGDETLRLMLDKLHDGKSSYFLNLTNHSFLNYMTYYFRHHTLLLTIEFNPRLNFFFSIFPSSKSVKPKFDDILLV